MRPSHGISWLLVLALVGCQEFDVRRPFDAFRSQAPDHDEPDDEFETKVETPMVGDYATVYGLHPIVLHGVGLVTRLNGNGGDPPASRHRTALLEEMRKHAVSKPNTLLQSHDTALVVVRAYLPPLIRKGEKFDVEVIVPPGDDTKSLNGGWLMETVLTEQAVAPGRGVLKGHILARAQGPVLVSTGEKSGEQSSMLKRGRVVAGGVATREDRHLALFLRNDYRSVRNSKRIADRIGHRFFDYDRHGIRKPLAEAKDDRKIELKVLSRYKDNFPRYLQVIRSVAFRETEVAQHVRMQKLERQLQNPETAERAAIDLEAIGLTAVPVLKTGLSSRNPEVRFHSAVALAYLGESDGLQVLHAAARDEPAFRIFAFAAMAAVDDAESHVLLRELLDEKSSETRYGAFRALSVLDKNDPFLQGETLNDQFTLHVLETDGPPLVHLTNRQRAEVVLFGAEQRFHTPLALRAGPHILITAPAGSDTVVISRYEVGQADRRKVVPARIADVIRTVASKEFGGTFPDIAQTLAQASRQNNLPGRIEIDALPRAGRIYYRTADGGGRSQAQVGRSSMAPNIFSLGDEESEEGDAGNDAGLPSVPAEDITPADLQTADRQPDEQEINPVRQTGFFRFFQKPQTEPQEANDD